MVRRYSEQADLLRCAPHRLGEGCSPRGEDLALTLPRRKDAVSIEELGQCDVELVDQAPQGLRSRW
jgi:hypothetical protein